MKLINAKPGCIALSVALALAAGPVAAEAKKPGMPPEQAALIQAWARSTAVYAATYCSATVGMYNLRDTVAVKHGAKAPPGTMWKFDQIATPEIAAQTGYVTPNVDVIYGFGFYDLGQEPVIVTAPDARPYVRMIIERLYPTLPVLSHVEIAKGVEIRVLGTMS